MKGIPAEIAQALDQLEQDIPGLRARHPDDFWDVYHARAREIANRAQGSAEQAALVAKRLDGMLAKHNLGPADPGA
ncbi:MULTISPECIES: hypothetical protein [Gammaproteobacteria]|uniref:Uncharacterized protein n=1 Tax=Xanthomonas boreopolis TaxID=86183 RepID=A0A919F665_9XANT|nr:hypothetical protein [Pseudomonas sp. Hp2]GHH50062.1 hypothetical protein GCM10009090_10310 [[Pseudomonas] boreopolis]